MTIQELLAQLLSNISDEFDKSVGSFFYDAEMPVAMELSAVYEKLEQIVANGYARTAVGQWLDYKVAEQGISRKSATFATGTVTLTGNDGTHIPTGMKVASNFCVFTVTSVDSVIENGTALVEVIADEAGDVGNVGAGAINWFPTTISGLLSVNNNEPTSGGYDEESDDELRERYFEKVSKPATSGNVYHYHLWASEVAGVGDARIIPLWNGNGTVKVVITDSEGGIAPQSLIDAVTSHIEEVRPIGADVTVVSATPKPINISVKVEGDTSDVARSVQAYLSTIQFGLGDEEVSYAKIGTAILNAVGVTDWEDLLVNGGTDNIPLNQEEVAILNGIEFIT